MRSVIKGIVAAGTLAVGSALLPGLANAAPVTGPTPYSDGLQVLSGDKLFTMTSCSVTAVNFVPSPPSGVGITSCGQLTVTPITVAGMFGFALNGAILALNGAQDDVSLQYDVHVLDPSKMITDAHLVFAGSSTGTAVAAVDETLVDTSGLECSLHANTATPADACTLARPATDLSVAKDILTFAAPPTTGSNLAQISIVDQFFSQTSVPEPATMAALGFGLTALGFLRRRRAK